MGKRSSFDPIPQDFYPTPLKAVLPLIPHLRGVRTFAEPCCGDGSLVRHLESFGLRCTYAGDIATGQDALTVHDMSEPDAVISNPPYDTDNRRKLMHALILHFVRVAPEVWLLIDYDWAATRQAAPFMRHCTNMVIMPRVKWIEGSKGNGKDNHSWYQFDINHTAGPVLHAWGSARLSSSSRLCAQCGKPYRPHRSDSRLCSDACRQRAYRERLSVTQA